MLRKKRNSILFPIILLFMSGCNVVKYLKPDQQLYTGASVKMVSAEKMELRPARREVKELLVPKPNQTVFGIRFKLWFYLSPGEQPKKKFKKMLKYKLGEKPVLYDPSIPVNVSDIIVNRLQNMGYFDARVDHSTQTSDQKTTVSYTAYVSRPYTIAMVNYPPEDNELAWALKEVRKNTLIRPGMRYDLDLIKEERERIEKELKEIGFFFFSQDQLLFRADTTIGSKQIRLRMEVKHDAPLKSRVTFRMDDIYIHSSDRLRDTTRRNTRIDTVVVDGYHYIRRDRSLRESVVTNAVLLKKGETYSRSRHSKSISRLMSMGTFHYAKIRFSDSLEGDSGKLDAHIYLTPMKKRTLQLVLQGVTKSNNYTGPQVSGNYKNRNLFRGAELLQLNVHTSYEWQLTGAQKGFNSYEVGGEAQLFLPNFLLPFNLGRVPTHHTPKTKFEVGFRNLHRVNYFRMNAVNFSYGYQWKETAEKEHLLNPVAINFAKVLESSADFEALLNENPYLRRSFEQQFTIGSNYMFTYNGLLNNPRSDQFYFNGMIDLSGNLVNAVQKSINDRSPAPEQPFTLFGHAYDMYGKFMADGRYYHDFNKNSRIATRALAGAGIPYGNSTSLPYIKQFFSGGANSLRAFLPRTVGPGVYVSNDSAAKRGFLDQAGDLRLEGNVEYRFTMISVLKGALFLDAGNIWLFNENEQLPGGKFNVNTFYRQLAVGTGFGMRIDITYFVLRFDLGMPLRKPYLAENKGWVHRDIDFSSRDWRKKNLVLNIAIGYPF